MQELKNINNDNFDSESSNSTEYEELDDNGNLKDFIDD